MSKCKENQLLVGIPIVLGMILVAREFVLAPLDTQPLRQFPVLVGAAVLVIYGSVMFVRLVRARRRNLD